MARRMKLNLRSCAVSVNRRVSVVVALLLLLLGSVLLVTRPNPSITSAEGDLVEDIRSNYLKAPSTEPYSLVTSPADDPSQFGQPAIILRLLKNLQRGFFVECGAFNGEYLSNTLYLEQVHGWHGLLIEPNQLNFRELLTKHRRAWSLNACLNDKPYKSYEPIGDERELSAIDRSPMVSYRSRESMVTCFPLEAVLKALNRTRVDYFSLDVEGLEMEVLKSIPFDRLDILTMSIEYNHAPGGMQAIVDYMRAQGYTDVETAGVDVILVHNSILDDVKQLTH